MPSTLALSFFVAQSIMAAKHFCTFENFSKKQYAPFKPQTGDKCTLNENNIRHTSVHEQRSRIYKTGTFSKICKDTKMSAQKYQKIEKL